MGRRPNQIIKGEYSECFYFLYSKPDLNGRHQVKLRLKIKNQKIIDLPVVVNRDKVKVVKQHFNKGRLTGGYTNGSLNEMNVYLIQIANKAVIIGDEFFKKKQELTALALSARLNKIEPDIVIDKQVNADTDLSKLNLSAGLKLNKVDSEFLEDFSTGVITTESIIQERKSKNEIDLIRKQSFEEIFKHPQAWDKTNIFELLGYIRYGSRQDANGDTIPFISKTFEKLYKKLIYYRINENPHEHVENFNEEWVHAFYRFIYKNGFEKRLHHFKANPFVRDKKYLIDPNSKKESYSVNTFGEGIHKHMVRYISELYIQRLIPANFKERIEPKAFTKKYDGNLTSYGDAIYFITPKEFLIIVHAKLDTKVFNQTRDLFVAQTMIGALRLKNLKGEKVIHEIDHFSLIRYKQAKVNDMLSNKLFEPVKKIIQKYGGKLPVMVDQDYNDNLKALFKHLKLDRKINKSIKKLEGQTTKEYKLYEIISNKFARSTYYVICGAMGMSIENIAKRAGHSTTDIAMKHYFNVTKDYTEQDILNLLKLFK